MEKVINIYNLHDPQQELDNIAYWKKKSPEEKLHCLEVIRFNWFKMKQKKSGNKQRLRRVIRIIEPS